DATRVRIRLLLARVREVAVEVELAVLSGPDHHLVASRSVRDTGADGAAGTTLGSARGVVGTVGGYPYGRHVVGARVLGLERQPSEGQQQQSAERTFRRHD